MEGAGWAEDEWERGEGLHRKSLLLLGESLQGLEGFGEQLLENLGQAESFSDENILRSVALTLEARGEPSRRIDALSLEVRQRAESGRVPRTWRHSIAFTGPGCGGGLGSEARLVAAGLLEEVVTNAVQQAEDANKVQLYFYHPLAGSEDVRQMTNALGRTRAALGDSATRLQTAYKIILVQAARQVVLSYRRILLDQAARLAAGEEETEVALETAARLLDVTNRVVELTVFYLKNATRDVVDTSVHDVKIILGRLTENNEVESVAEIETESTHL